LRPYLKKKKIITKIGLELKALSSNPSTEEKKKSQALKICFSKKHMKKCSPSLAIKEMQIKTTLRFHLAPVE
jgi:hypothetical protein